MSKTIKKLSLNRETIRALKVRSALRTGDYAEGGGHPISPWGNTSNGLNSKGIPKDAPDGDPGPVSVDGNGRTQNMHACQYSQVL